jgi:hypothetical protein
LACDRFIIKLPIELQGTCLLWYWHTIWCKPYGSG